MNKKYSKKEKLEIVKQIISQNFYTNEEWTENTKEFAIYCKKCNLRIQYKNLDSLFNKWKNDNNYVHTCNSCKSRAMQLARITDIRQIYERTPIQSQNKNDSKIHKKVREYLLKLKTNHDVDVYEEVRFAACIGHFQPLPFDFLIQKGNNYICIEVNGEQHYKKSFGEDDYEFRLRQEYDRRKAEFCKEAGIELIVIRFDEIDQVESILDSKLKDRL